jgi:DNA-binding NtrC family response regulator
VLQEGEVYRVGSAAPRRADVRVVSATHRDVPTLLAEGRFREDLYYRIAVWVVEVPPLRRRKGDIPNLAAHFLAREAARRGVQLRGVSRAALDALVAYTWPGNIRQLAKEMARAVLFLTDGELLDRGRLSPGMTRGAAPVGTRGLPQILESVERDEIELAFQACNGDVAATAERLGLGRSTLYRRMKELGLKPQE